MILFVLDDRRSFCKGGKPLSLAYTTPMFGGPTRNQYTECVIRTLYGTRLPIAFCRHILDITVLYQAAEDKPEGSGVESGPGYLGSMSVSLHSESN